MTENVGAVIVQSPNFFGIIEDLKTTSDIVHKYKKSRTYSICRSNIIRYIKKARRFGSRYSSWRRARYGNPIILWGGPYLGFLATNKKNI